MEAAIAIQALQESIRRSGTRALGRRLLGAGTLDLEPGHTGGASTQPVAARGGVPAAARVGAGDAGPRLGHRRPPRRLLHRARQNGFLVHHGHRLR